MWTLTPMSAFIIYPLYVGYSYSQCDSAVLQNQAPFELGKANFKYILLIFHILLFSCTLGHTYPFIICICLGHLTGLCPLAICGINIGSKFIIEIEGLGLGCGSLSKIILGPTRLHLSNICTFLVSCGSMSHCLRDGSPLKQRR
jgi:hypothetical protein